jgi:hypothetical protein
MALPGSSCTRTTPGAMYVQWPLDRRLEGFLHYRGLTRVADDGDLYNIILDRVMTHISTATVRDPARTRTSRTRTVTS